MTVRPDSAQAAGPEAYVVDVTVDAALSSPVRSRRLGEGRPRYGPARRRSDVAGALDYLRLRIMGVPPSDALKRFEALQTDRRRFTGSAAESESAQLPMSAPGSQGQMTVNQ